MSPRAMMAVKTKRKHGTKEWATKSQFNILSGCQHDCIYCFARERLVNTKKVASAADWPHPVLRPKDLLKKYRPKDIEVMYPSSHDIHPDYLFAHLYKIDQLVKAFTKVVIVMKPHKECVESLCWNFRDYRKKILFRFSIGSANPMTLKYWEPKAPGLDERTECLKIARNHGFETSVSAEPLLDATPYQLVRNLSPLVTDTIWIGRINRGINCLRAANMWNSSVEEVYNELMRHHSEENIMKMYSHLKGNKKVRWKDSMREVIEKHLGKKLPGYACADHN